MDLRIATLCLVALCRGTFCAEDPPLKTMGPVVESPLQVACWRRLNWEKIEVSEEPWVFPMIYRKWNHAMDPKDYAQYFIDEIKKRPATQPIWLQTHGWYGILKPNTDPDHYLMHEGDRTPQGTPGLWPAKGFALWKERTVEFLKRLKGAGCRVDCWPLDHESNLAAAQLHGLFNVPDVYRNMVLDPRWKTEPLPGLGIMGSALLDPALVEADKPTLFKNRHGVDGAPDSRVAYDTAGMAAQFVRYACLEEIFAKPFLEAYPHGKVGNYATWTKVIDFEAAQPTGRAHDNKDCYASLKKTLPQLKELRGPGNLLCPSPFPKSPKEVDEVLAWMKPLVQRYGADNFCPWIFPANYGRAKFDDEGHAIKTSVPEPNLTQQEFERLLLGYVELGARRMVLWNSGAEADAPDAERNTIEALKKACAAAEARDTKAKAQK